MIIQSENAAPFYHFSLPSFDEQAALAEKHGLETLLFCPDSWALRHVFIDPETGETVRARCNRWDCLYCGPRKVDQWRQLVKAALKRWLAMREEIALKGNYYGTASVW